MNKITGKQIDILRFIHNYILDNSYPPSLREIGKEFGMTSSNGANYHLKRLEGMDYITRKNFLSRAITLTKKAIILLNEDKNDNANH